jgi:catechol 2,3-dioxygenase-like lactoylglutathione lyase family enzyme
MNLTDAAAVLVVEDVARSLDYYRDKLGFEGRPYEQDPTQYAYASRQRCNIHLAQGRPHPNGFFDVYVYVDDVDALHEELRFRDPDGYVLAFGMTP